MVSAQPGTNPFKVFSPEGMTANDVHALFVNPFTDFNKIAEAGHTMVNGPRGCGKSMIFRYLLPDCQRIARECEIAELPFLAILISIKNTAPNLTEFRRLSDQHAHMILNEHVLTMFVATKVFQSVANLPINDSGDAFEAAKSYFLDVFSYHLTLCGGQVDNIGPGVTTAKGVFEHVEEACVQLHSDVVQYGKRMAFQSEEAEPYNSALCGYLDFLFPVLAGLKDLSFLPGGPVYLLIDDADYLNIFQTTALNTWLSTRTQGDVSIKVSTQLRYKTLATSSGLPIQSPHDYQEINIADIYTSNRGSYRQRVEEIVRLRLQRAGVASSPAEFFPKDCEQERKISDIGAKIRKEWPESGRGHRASDDVLRYARPNFIRSLGGASKSRSTYSYAGFEQLVHISSGLIRYFLEPAAVMYGEQQSVDPGRPVEKITPGIQNRVVRDEANRLILDRFAVLGLEESGDAKRYEQLSNLIRGLGGAFFLKLISDEADRRVFSVAISGQPDLEVEEVFELGVRHSYFHRSSIGNKEGTGRARLYVLTRRLAPYFTLDPTSFAGYLWVTANLLREAMANPDALLGRIKRDGVSNVLEKTKQLTLFD